MKRQVVDRYDGPRTTGIDVSHHNGQISWKGIQTDFGFVRTGDGKDVDRRVEDNLKGGYDNLAFMGTYRYLRADRGGLFQAELDLEILAKSGVRLTLPMVADVEQGIEKNLTGGIWGDSLGTIPIDVVFQELLDYLQAIEEETKVRPMVYGGQYLHWKLSQGAPHLAAQLARYPLWVASYVKGYPRMPVDAGGRPFPWSHWTFHQYTNKGSVKGIQGGVDLNYFRGDMEGLRAFSESQRHEGCAPSQIVDQLERIAACFKKTDRPCGEAILTAAGKVRKYEADQKLAQERARRHRRGIR